jgi:hypothetical protein
VFNVNIKWNWAFFIKIRPMPKNFAQMAKFRPIWSPWTGQLNKKCKLASRREKMGGGGGHFFLGLAQHFIINF